jgi:Flp pilus assembly protein TadD
VGRCGELEGAEAAWQRADDRDAHAANNLGVLLQQRGDLEGAEAAYRRGDDRGNADAAYNLGVLRQQSGDVEAAPEASTDGAATMRYGT